LRGHKKPLLGTYARPTLFGLFQSSRLLDATNNRKWGLHTSAMRSVATMPVAAWYFESLYLPGNIRQQQNEKTKQACPTPNSMLTQDFVVATRDFFIYGQQTHRAWPTTLTVTSIYGDPQTTALRSRLKSDSIFDSQRLY